MKHLIKVERVKEKDKERIDATRVKLLTTIFPDYTESGYNSEYNCVHFKNLTSASYYNTALLGIQLEGGSYGKMLRRRVMIKGDYIDADALRQKYEEVKLHASAVKEREENSAKYGAEAEAVYGSVIDKLGLDFAERWHYNIHSDTKTTVKINGKTDWQGLKLIQETLNKPIMIELKLSIPVEHAKLVYETLNRIS